MKNLSAEPHNADRFMTALRASRLCPPEQLQMIENAARSQSLDGAALARHLVSSNQLTPFQAEHVLTGHAMPLVLGPYRILERIGSGGMGQVYRAEHGKMKRDVALKVLAGHLLPVDDILARFEREVQVAAQVVHPNVVTAFDAAEDAGYHYLVMEYVAGADLGRYVLESGPLPIPMACECLRQVSQGLAHAYERGYVHGDIKPANMLLKELARPSSFTVKLLDFGLAQQVGTASEEQDRPATADSSGFGGTPDFLAPEKARDDYRTDIRSDLYSLGCSLYYLLSGRVPFPGSTWSEKLLRHQFETPAPIAQLRPEIPAEVGSLIERLLAKDPALRPQTPAELAATLRAIVIGQSPAADCRHLIGSTGEARTCLQGEEATWPSYHHMLPVEPADASMGSRSSHGRPSLRIPSGGWFAGLSAVALGLLLAWAYACSLPPSWKGSDHETGSYVNIQSAKGRAFRGLEGAIAAATDHEVITIQGDGPFVLEPLVIGANEVTIQAAPGCRPHMVYSRPAAAPSWRPLFSATSSLTLKGLDLELRETRFEGTPPTAHLVYLTGGTLRLVDCGLTAPGCQALVVCRQAAAVELSECRMSAESTPLCIEAADDGEAFVRVLDCDLRVAHPQAAALAIWGGHGSKVQLSIHGSSIAGGRILGLGGLAGPISIEAVDNRFCFQEALISASGAGIREQVSWEGHQNRYENAGCWLMTDGRTAALRGLQAWREFWKSPDDGSLEKPSSYTAQPVSRAARF